MRSTYPAPTPPGRTIPAGADQLRSGGSGPGGVVAIFAVRDGGLRSLGVAGVLGVGLAGWLSGV
ncbi:MAG TPA: hypothetical protein PLP95_07645, partial [Microthrixaceae bacterium]|nr:hypothetical protein [Microthrixaceae bacterium]